MCQCEKPTLHHGQHHQPIHSRRDHPYGPKKGSIQPPSIMLGNDPNPRRSVDLLERVCHAMSKCRSVTIETSLRCDADNGHTIARRLSAQILLIWCRRTLAELGSECGCLSLWDSPTSFSFSHWSRSCILTGTKKSPWWTLAPIVWGRTPGPLAPIESDDNGDRTAHE